MPRPLERRAFERRPCWRRHVMRRVAGRKKPLHLLRARNAAAAGADASHAEFIAPLAFNRCGIPRVEPKNAPIIAAGAYPNVRLVGHYRRSLSSAWPRAA